MKISEIIKSAIKAIETFQTVEYRMQQMVRREVKNAKKAIIQTFAQTFFFFFGGALLISGLIVYISKEIGTDITLLLFGIILLLIGGLIGLARK